MERGIPLGYGVDDGSFGVGKELSRCDMMVNLWYEAQKPFDSSYEMPFKDVIYPEDSEEYKAIAWGYTEGIVKGFPE